MTSMEELESIDVGNESDDFKMTKAETSSLNNPSTVFLREIQDLKENLNKISMHLTKMKTNVEYTILSLTKCYRQFETNFVKELSNSKVKLKKKMTRSFLKVTKEQLPSIYLRSIPKFGGDDLSNAMHATLLKMKRLSEKSGQVVSISYSKEMVEEINTLLETKIDRNFLDPREIIENLIREIENSIYNIRDLLDQIEMCLFTTQKQNENFIDKLLTMKKVLNRKNLEEETLKVDFKERDSKMDHLREDVKKYNKMLEEQRNMFFKEITNLRTILYEKKEKGKKVDPKNLPVGEFTINYIIGKGDRLKVKRKTDMEMRINQRIDSLQRNFVLEKDKIEKQAKKIIEEKDKQIDDIERKIKQLESKIKRINENKKKEYL